MKLSKIIKEGGLGKEAGIFNGMPRGIIKEIIRKNIGEDSKLNKVTKLSPSDLKNGEVYMATQGGSPIAMIWRDTFHKELGYWVKGYNSIFDRTDDYKKFNLKTLKEDMEKTLEAQSLPPFNKLNWNTVSKIDMPSLRGPSRNKKVDPTIPQIDRKDFKRWIIKSIIKSQNKMIGKYEAYLESYFDQLIEAVKNESSSDVFQNINEKNIEKMRDGLTSLRDFSKYLNDVFGITWFGTKNDSNVTFDEAKHIKEKLNNAMKLTW